MPRLALLLLCIATPAFAQTAGNLQLDDFHPAIDSRGYLTQNASAVLDDKELSFGLGSLEWGHHLLELPNGYEVNNVISATLVGALGLKVAGVPFEIGAALPFTIMNGQTDAMGRLDGQGIGDLGLHLKARLAHVGRFGLGAIASVYLPTASPSDRFLGESGVTPQLVGVVDASFGRLRIAVNGGVRLRPTSTFDMGMETITTSTELPVGVGAAWAVSPQKFELIGEVFGAIPVGETHGYQSLEALAGVKLYLAKNSYLSLGAGRGLAPSEAGNPDFRGFIGIVFEPKAAERVTARIPDDDTVAMAPPPPPKNDFPDRDNDGIRDDLDKCPDDPENYNGYQDEDGCPDDDIVTDVGTKLVVLRSIEFEFDSAVIRPSSYEVLDAIVMALDTNKDIQLVEVQGHTDERGDDEYNLDLSNRRAASVVAYLTKHGIAAARLRSQGYGETRPLDKAHTEAAWTKNRRVEFIIEKRD